MHTRGCLRSRAWPRDQAGVAVGDALGPSGRRRALCAPPRAMPPRAGSRSLRVTPSVMAVHAEGAKRGARAGSCGERGCKRGAPAKRSATLQGGRSVDVQQARPSRGALSRASVMADLCTRLYVWRTRLVVSSLFHSAAGRRWRAAPGGARRAAPGGTRRAAPPCGCRREPAGLDLGRREPLDRPRGAFLAQSGGTSRRGRDRKAGREPPTQGRRWAWSLRR